MPEVFRQTVWIGGICGKAEKQEVVQGATRYRALRRWVPFSFRVTLTAGPVPSLPHGVLRGFEMTALRNPRAQIVAFCRSAQNERV
jgi:hypothetical protein